MASAATAIAQKRLREFLKEQQEPFILDDYLLERGCFKTWTTHRSNKNINKSVLPFSRVLTSLYNKFNQGTTKIKQPDHGNDEDVVVTETPTIDEVEADDRFSSASSSTLFNSCSDVDEHQTSFSSDTCEPSSNLCHIGAVQSQQAINNGKHGWKCIGPVSLRKILSRRTPLSQNVRLAEVGVNEDGRRMEKRMQSCKKMREESLLSAAVWGLFIQSVKKERDRSRLGEIMGPNVSPILKSKRVFQKTKQLLFYGVRTLPNREQGYKQFLGPQLLGELIFKRTKQWTCGRNLTYSFSVDDVNSIYQWCDFEPHVKEISVEIADAILECIINEIVSENIESLPVMSQT